MEEQISQSAPSTAEVTEPKEVQAPSQKPQRTEKEKAEFTLKSTAERLKELGGDPVEVLGVRPTIKIDDSLEDDAPLTVGTFRELQKQDARKTAEQLADAITDETERERVKAELKFIVPSGDAQADLRRAQAAANVERNAKIIEEAQRRGHARVTASGGSQPATQEDMFEPTPEESVFMRPPYNLSKEKILAARKAAAEKQP